MHIWIAHLAILSPLEMAAQQVPVTTVSMIVAIEIIQRSCAKNIMSCNTILFTNVMAAMKNFVVTVGK